MRGARSVYGTHEKYIQNFNQESWSKDTAC
jgi:hypothetical protein